MSLLEAARRLIVAGPAVYDSFCLDCHRQVEECGDMPAHEHAPDCATRALPQIVAVLEAATDLVEHGFVTDGEYRVRRCGACDQVIVAGKGHEPDCRGQALVAALRGEVS